MFGVPNSCWVHKVIDLKKLPLFDLEPKERRRFLEMILEMELVEVVNGNQLPVFVDDTYRVEAIQFLSLKLDSIAHAQYAADILQKSVKTFAVLYFSDGKRECYSFALKRLNKNNPEQVVVTEQFLSEVRAVSIGTQLEDEFVRVAGFESAVNRSSLFSWYLEIMVKCFILKNRSVWSGMEILLVSKVWYDSVRVLEMFGVLQRLVRVNEKRTRAVTMSESLEANGELKKIYGVLEGYF